MTRAQVSGSFGKVAVALCGSVRRPLVSTHRIFGVQDAGWVERSEAHRVQGRWASHSSTHPTCRTMCRYRMVCAERLRNRWRTPTPPSLSFPLRTIRWAIQKEDIKITDAAHESTGVESASPGAVIIRAPSADDETAVWALARRFATSFTVAEAAFSAAFAEVVVDPAACCRVAEKQGVLVGYVLGFDHQTFFASGRVAWVEEIMIAEDLRGRGIGRTLMHSFENWARQRDCRLVALATRRAMGFYRSLEYVESATYFRKLLQ